MRALQMGPVSRVAPLDKLSVVLTVLAGALLFGEILTWRVLLGVALMAAGAIVLASG